MRLKQAVGSQAGMVILFLGTALAQGPSAPPRPVCTHFGTETGACRWNSTHGLGPGVRVVLFDAGNRHERSKDTLRQALDRLSAQYGFIFTPTDSLDGVTEAKLTDAKVIILSNGEGDVGGNPSAAVMSRVENFVEQRGWGVLAVHAACAYVSTWPFLQDVCVQQHFHHNAANTPANVYVVDSSVDGVGHGRRNPYASFLLEGLPDTVKSMKDEWFTWLANPRTTHQFNRESKNKVMLLALDESSFTSVAPRYPGEHYAAWTHTMGPADGVAIHYSPGHDDVYTQGARAYGDTLLWRMLRYAAKDWCQIGQPGCGDPTALQSDPSAGKAWIHSKGGSLFIASGQSRTQSVTVSDMNGRRFFAAKQAGNGEWKVAGLRPGLYFVRVWTAGETRTRKVLHRD